MRCLVTGATGFIGSHVVEMLLQKGCQVAVLMRPTSDPWRIEEYRSSLCIVEGDLAGVADIRDQIDSFQPQVLIHAGWQGVDRHRRDGAGQVSNMHHTLKLFDLCVATGCEMIIGFGSQAEYGQTNQTLREDMPAYPDTLYGAAKLLTGLLAERKCADLDFPFAWLRLTAAYGPKDDPSHLIPYVISSLLGGETPALTYGRQRWDYLYIDDVTGAVWDIMAHPAARGIFNLSSGRSIAVHEICEMIRDSIDSGLPLGLGDVPYPDGARMILEASNDRLQKATHWEPKVSWRDGLAKTIAWHAKQRQAQIRNRQSKKDST